jgi:hypothetical protein
VGARPGHPRPARRRLAKLRVIAVKISSYGVLVRVCAAASGPTALVLLRAASRLFAGWASVGCCCLQEPASPPTWPVVAALQIFLGLVFDMFDGVQQTRATEAMPEACGSAVSAFALALFLGQSAGPPAFGRALAVVGCRGGFTAAGTLMLAASRWNQRGLAPSPQPTDLAAIT